MSLMPMQGNPAELQQIANRRKLAEQLMQQGQDPLQGQVVSGHYVAPSWTQQLAKGLNMYMGAKGMREADEAQVNFEKQKQQAIAEALKGGDRSAIYGAVSKYGKDPSLELALGDLNYGRERTDRQADIQDARTYEGVTHARNREEQLQDIKNTQEFQRIMQKEQQGFALTQQERSFAQQFQMQKQAQNFQAGQNAQNQQFQAGQGQLNRAQQLQLLQQKQNLTANPQTQKVNDARDVLQILNQADPLVKQATHSGLGAMIDKGQSFFGGSSPSANAAAQLKALEGNLVSKMPKMSGPQSDKDVLMYKQMAGQIGDPTVPIEQKQAAMNAIREINSRYAGGDMAQPTSNVRQVDW